MSRPAERIATYDDLLGVPEHLVAELIHGVLHTHPRPSHKHAWASSRVGGELDHRFSRGKGGPGGLIILDEPELHLLGNVLVPDLAGWRRKRLPKLPETAWFELAPDWICEVLSPATAKVDRLEKIPLYAQAGVGHLWLIDPDLRTLEVYALQADGHWLLLATLGNDAQVSEQPFDAIRFDLAVLWPDE